MSFDDIPLVGSGEDSTTPASRPAEVRARWIGAVVAVVIVGVMLSLDGRGTVGAEVDSTLAPLPSVLEPPEVTEPIVVVEQSEWRSATGLEAALDIFDMVRFDDTYMLIGASEAGIAVWRSEDGSQWDPVSTIPDTEAVREASAGVVGQQLVVIGAHPIAGGASDAIHVSSDATNWESYPLPEAGNFQIVDHPASFVLYGVGNRSPITPEMISALPSPIPDLVEEGWAFPSRFGDSLTVILMPGIPIYSSELSELDLTEEPPPIENPTRGLFVGPDPGSLTRAETPSAAPYHVTTLEDRRLVGITNNEVVISSDGGKSWELASGFISGWDFKPWEEGLIYATPDRVGFWSPEAPAPIDLSPPEMVPIATAADGEPGSQPYLLHLASTGQGISAVAISYIESDDAPSRIVAGQTRELHLRGEGIQVFEGGEVVFESHVSQVDAQLRDDGESLTILGTGGEEIVTVAMSDYLEAIGGRTDESDWQAHIVHSRDGLRWSLTPWPLTETEGISFPHLVAVGDLSLVTEIRPGGQPIHDPRIGIWGGE